MKLRMQHLSSNTSMTDAGSVYFSFNWIYNLLLMNHKALQEKYYQVKYM